MQLSLLVSSWPIILLRYAQSFLVQKYSIFLILPLLSWFRGLINVFETPAITLEIFHAQDLLTVAMAIWKNFKRIHLGRSGKTIRMRVIVL